MHDVLKKFFVELPMTKSFQDGGFIYATEHQDTGAIFILRKHEDEFQVNGHNEGEIYNLGTAKSESEAHVKLQLAMAHYAKAHLEKAEKVPNGDGPHDISEDVEETEKDKKEKAKKIKAEDMVPRYAKNDEEDSLQKNAKWHSFDHMEKPANKPSHEEMKEADDYHHNRAIHVHAHLAHEAQEKQNQPKEEYHHEMRNLHQKYLGAGKHDKKFMAAAKEKHNEIDAHIEKCELNKSESKKKEFNLEKAEEHPDTLPKHTIASHELELHTDNTPKTHAHKEAMFSAMKKKHEKGQFDRHKALKGLYQVSHAAAKDYHKEHGTPGDKHSHTFTPADKKIHAHHMLNEFHHAMKNGELDHLGKHESDMEKVFAHYAFGDALDPALEKKYEGFKAVEASAARSGAANPAAVAAKIGMEKYGKKKFEAAAHAGKKMKKKEKSKKAK